MTTARPATLVLGATGRIGGRLLARRRAAPGEDGLAVRAAVRSPDQASRFAAEGIESAHLDLDDLATYAPALAGVERLFLLTGYTVAMLEQSKNLVDAARAAGVRHIVHVGTFHPPGGPSSRLVRHYVWHQLVESYIEGSGIGWTHLHPNAFMQNVHGAIRDGVLRFFFADQRIGLIDCENVARVAAASLRDPARHQSGRYFLSTEALTMDEAAVILSEKLATAIRYEAVPPEALRAGPLPPHMERAYFDCLATMAERMQRGELPDFAQVTTTVEAVTGQPPTGFRSFVRRERAALLPA